jgi:major membrane immunogen (membrane-anchored lipoprotein)
MWKEREGKMKKNDFRNQEKIIKELGHIPTKEELFEKLIQSQEKMIQALAGAARTAPDDPEIRKQLLKAMEKAIRLRKRIYRSFGKKAPSLQVGEGVTLEVDEEKIS